MRFVSFSASVVLTLAAVLTACSDSPAPSSTCASTQDCPFGQLCSVQTRQCVPEPAQGVFGRFSCTAHASAPQMEVGGTDVVANLDGHRYVLATGTTCLITDHYLVVTVHEVTGDLSDHQLGFVVDIAKISPGAPYQLFDTQSTQPYAIVDSGALTRGANFDVIGVITGGSLTFDQVPQLEQTVSGTIDAGLRVYSPPATVVCDDGLSGHTDCNQCLDDANAPGGCCEAQIQACADSTACSDLVSCFGGCAGDDACLDGCYATHAEGTPIFKAWSSCETGDASAGTVGACGALCN